MSSGPHIVIIGAGLIGLSCADSLSRAGARVTVLDSARGPGTGASFCNSGMIHPSQAWPWLDVDGAKEAARSVFDLAMRSRTLLSARRRELGLPARPKGCLQLFDSASARAQVRVKLAEIGVTSRLYDGPWDAGKAALEYDQDRWGDAYAYCRALYAALAHKGVNFIWSSPAKLATENGRAVITTGASLPAPDHIIVAAGARSQALLQPIGVNVGIVPITGHALNFARPDGPLPDIPIMHQPSRSALTAFDDHVRLSGTVGAPDPENLIPIWQGIFPELMAKLGAPFQSWSADRPASRWGRPVISASAYKNLWVNTGHGHMGWSLCAASGAVMAAMILAEKADERFALPGL